MIACQEQGRDRYGRALAVCTINGKDVARELLRAGLALAYRRYSMDYAAARTHRKGKRAGKFTLPWEWRQRSKR